MSDPLRVGERVAYIGESWLGRGMMSMYPQGAVVVDIDSGTPILRWPSGGLMIVGEPKALAVTGDALEEILHPE